ncbi:hypothetical protein, partial [Trinickia dabaoshanensis]|uniref:hypothetical protein n=1 Tax=Trinickia dabaoshanensis TaxID=564714 RepID=UPI001E2B6EDB
ANDIESVRIKEIQHQNDMTRIGTAALWKATAAPRRRYFNSLLKRDDPVRKLDSVPGLALGQ